jgi:hypothetical protein
VLHTIVREAKQLWQNSKVISEIKFFKIPSVLLAAYSVFRNLTDFVAPYVGKGGMGT